MGKLTNHKRRQGPELLAPGTLSLLQRQLLCLQCFCMGLVKRTPHLAHRLQRGERFANVPNHRRRIFLRHLVGIESRKDRRQKIRHSVDVIILYIHKLPQGLKRRKYTAEPYGMIRGRRFGGHRSG